MNILKVQNISNAYSKGNLKNNALKNVTFSVENGELVAILGLSGAGKSTLLHAISGFNKPIDGFILLIGTDIYSLNDSQMCIFRRKNIGQIYEFYDLFSELNVEENITFPLFIDGRKVEKNYLDEVINVLELDNIRNLMPSKLSKWDILKIYIGRALITKPSIVLADEPTRNLDIASSDKIIGFLKYFNDYYDQTILVSTHDEKIANKTKRTIILKNGHIYNKVTKR